MKSPSAGFWRRLHGIMTIFWAIMLPISVLTPLKNSLPYIVGLSVYALFAAHFSSWQGARAECKAEDNASG